MDAHVISLANQKGGTAKNDDLRQPGHRAGTGGQEGAACRCRCTGKPAPKPWLGARRAADSKAVKNNMPSLEERRVTF